jgi:hypothetical protein
MFRLFRLNDSKHPVSSRNWVGRLGAGLACGLVLLGSMMPGRAAFEWKVAQIDGRDYVSAADVKQFYGFPRLQRDGRAVWFRSQALMMKWNVGSDDIFINNVKFCLSFPVQERNGQAMVSRVDLVKLLHPIIRPSHIQNAVGFNTVVIDPGRGRFVRGREELHTRHGLPAEAETGGGGLPDRADAQHRCLHQPSCPRGDGKSRSESDFCEHSL